MVKKIFTDALGNTRLSVTSLIDKIKIDIDDDDLFMFICLDIETADELLKELSYQINIARDYKAKNEA